MADFSLFKDLPLFKDPETRSVAILGAYLVSALLLIVFIAGYLRRAYLNHVKLPALSANARAWLRVKTTIFVALAALSFCVTWYHMLAFFAHSYRTWAVARGVALPQGASLTALVGQGDKLELGRWLKDVTLFRDAWQTACYTSARFWWTQQIFLIATMWTLFLSIEGSQRGISFFFAYMLLGQLVAVSLALNLSFLTVSFHARRRVKPSAVPKTPSGTVDPFEYVTKIRALVLVTMPVVLSFVCIAIIPAVVNHPDFLTILVIPHLLLFLPLFFSPDDDTKSSHLRYGSWTFTATCAAAALLLSRATLAVLKMNPSQSMAAVAGTLLDALYEHPAVSSVGWDVILCYLSSAVWLAVRAAEPSRARE